MPEAPFDLDRVVTAQAQSYAAAVTELKRGQKRGHWIWFVFPQIAGLGSSPMSQAYAIGSLEEARAYASCKEAFRVRPSLRAAVSGVREAEPWIWSIAEEELCSVLWLATYASRRGKPDRPTAAHLDDLITIAHAGFLPERSLFDVGARVHPHAATFLPAERQRRLFEFVARHRLVSAGGTGWLRP